MIRIDPRVVDSVRAATVPADLYTHLNDAIALEHSTIPPYLTAMLSLIPGRNDHIAALIHSIVLEEMLHLSIAANILIAIGGKPALNTPEFVPRYPGPLPMSIGGAAFEVGIEPFSIKLVQTKFMTIEEPDHPIPIAEARLASFAPTYKTIGDFYRAIAAKLTELGDGIFTVGPDHQMLSWFPPEELFPITDSASAAKAIDIIVEEGEGTRSDPFERPDDPAHFYKFGEIAAGRALVKLPGGTFAYSGELIPFDPEGVYPMKANCKIAHFGVGTQAGDRIRQFAYLYSSLLNALHDAFNGNPDGIGLAMGLMFDLKVTSTRLMTTPTAPGSETTVGPSFEYVTTSSG